MTIAGFTLNTRKLSRELKEMSVPNKRKFRRSVLTDAQDILLVLIKQHSPRKTGSYAKSWRKEDIRKGLARVTTPQKKLFQILEFKGSPPQTILPRYKQALKFTTEQGVIVFAKRTNPKGFDAIPHVRPAVRKLDKNMTIIISANMDKLSILFQKSATRDKQKVENLKKSKVTNVEKKKGGTRKLRNQGSK